MQRIGDSYEFLKTKKKGMQKIEQKTEEKYGVDKRLCNSTHE